MQHQGEIIKKAVEKSGHSITNLAKKMNKSRRWVYQIFETQTVSVEYVLKIGDAIYHDFSNEIESLGNFTQSKAAKIEDVPNFGSDREEADYWRDKYIGALEAYNQLLLKG